MILQDIAPYLRFVNTICFEPIQQDFRAADCHFYYLTEPCTLSICGKLHTLAWGTTVLLPAGTPYHFVAEGKLRIISINFDFTQAFSHMEQVLPPVLAGLLKEEDILQQPDFFDHPEFNQPLLLENMEHLEPNIQAILNEHTEKKHFYREIASGYFRNILLEMLRCLPSVGEEKRTADRILRYIREHCAEELSNTQLSQLAGYHPYHLNRLIKRSTGTTLRQYLIHCRLEMAKQLLRESELPVAQVAERCGYGSPCSFSAEFKQKTGSSPAKYREALRNLG